MVDAGIVNFIKNGLAQGKTKEQISRELANGGSAQADIEAAFSAATMQQTQNLQVVRSTKTFASQKAIFLTIGCLVILGAGYFVYAKTNLFLATSRPVVFFHIGEKSFPSWGTHTPVSDQTVTAVRTTAMSGGMSVETCESGALSLKSTIGEAVSGNVILWSHFFDPKKNLCLGLMETVPPNKKHIQKIVSIDQQGVPSTIIECVRSTEYPTADSSAAGQLDVYNCTYNGQSKSSLNDGIPDYFPISPSGFPPGVSLWEKWKVLSSTPTPSSTMGNVQALSTTSSATTNHISESNSPDLANLPGPVNGFLVLPAEFVPKGFISIPGLSAYAHSSYLETYMYTNSVKNISNSQTTFAISETVNSPTTSYALEIAQKEKYFSRISGGIEKKFTYNNTSGAVFYLSSGIYILLWDDEGGAQPQTLTIQLRLTDEKNAAAYGFSDPVNDLIHLLHKMVRKA